MTNRLTAIGVMCCLVAFAPPGLAAERIHKVVHVQVREKELVATFLRPNTTEVVPGLIVLGGSEGGIPFHSAHRFAAQGWGALAVAYFGLEGLPRTLANVPLEYFEGAVTWIQQQPNVDCRNLSAVGASRGGELAPLLASRNHAFKRVVALVPSSVVWGPLEDFADKTISSWSFAGRPLPYVPPDARPHGKWIRGLGGGVSHVASQRRPSMAGGGLTIRQNRKPRGQVRRQSNATTMELRRRCRASTATQIRLPTRAIARNAKDAAWSVEIMRE